MALGRDSGENKEVSSRERKSMRERPEVQRLEGAAFVSTLRALVLGWLLGHLALWSCQSKGSVWGGKGGDITEHTLLQIQHNYNKAT